MYKPVSRLEFLQLIKVVKMLYGRDTAEKVFTKNINMYYNLDSTSFTLKKEV